MSQDLVDLVLALKPPTEAFEKCLFDLAQGKTLSLMEWKARARDLAPFSSLRVLSLLSRRQPRPEFQWQFVQGTSALSEKSRKFFLNAFAPAETTETFLSFDPKSEIMKSANVEIKMVAGSFEAQWIRLIAGHQEFSTELALEQLYGEPWSEHGFQRLRVALHRMNQKMSSQLGLKKLFTVKKSRILCAQIIQIRP